VNPPETVPRVGSPEAVEAQRAQMNGAQDLRSAFDENAIVAITDSHGRITFVNDRLSAISKYPRDELPGQDHEMVNAGDQPKELFRELWTTIKRGEVWRGEIRNCAKDGSFHWVATTIVPILDPGGTPQQFVAIRSDITEQKRVEAELAERLCLQRLLAELSSRFVALPSGQVDAAIAETQRLIAETMGLDRSTLWQTPEHGSRMVLTHCWQRPGWPPLPMAFATEGMPPWAYATLMRGETICFKSIMDLPPEAPRDSAAIGIHCPKSNVTIPLIANGRTFGALAFSTLGDEREWREEEVAELRLIAQIIGNVVGRQRAELREEQLRGELAHAMRLTALGELTAALAHELNQPLAAILSNAQAARRFIAGGQIEPDELSVILDDIVRDNKRAGAVISNLRAMVGKHPAVRDACCLNDLVREVVELLNAEWVGEKVEVRFALEPDLPAVEVACVELQQVLVNLLVNAVQAMKDTPSENRFIEVATSTEAGAVAVRIRDHGHGIPPEQLSGIFEPFGSTRPGGLGLGLSICRRIIESHSGRIEARNHDDGGAVFCFSLPVAGGAQL
jgi:PAS domain S-box-containing protein